MKVSRMEDNNFVVPVPNVVKEVQVPANVASTFVQQEESIVEPKLQGEISEPCEVNSSGPRC